MRTIDSRGYIETVLSDDGDLRRCLCALEIDGYLACYDEDEPYTVCSDDDAGFYQQACCFLLDSLAIATSALEKIGSGHIFESAEAAERWARDVANNALEKIR